MGEKGPIACVGVFVALLCCAIPIAMIVLGVQHKEECPMQPWIPIFMIVSGATSIGIIVLSLCTFGAGASDRGCLSVFFIILLVLTSLFFVGWQIAGSVWVFSKWSSWDSGIYGPKDCHKDMYLFAFAMLIIFWITCPCSGGSSKSIKEAV